MKESNAFHQSQDKLTLLLGNEILPQSVQSLTPTSAFYLKCNNLFFKGNKHSLRSSIPIDLKRITEVHNSSQRTHSKPSAQLFLRNDFKVFVAF